jgi:hypothetical protein
VIKRIARVGIVIAMLLCLVEGLASFIAVVTTADGRGRRVVEQRHTKYDPDLGWVSLPNLDIPDMYGPDVRLRTNAQGFRNDAPVPVQTPSDRLRIVCSGGSFTLGAGVSNGEAWCNRLATLDEGLDTVNMGQGGYGLDQAYLWYRRDGTKIKHDIQILAVVTDDFARMRSTTSLGYPKPVLALEDGQLQVRNVPVPQRSELSTQMRSMAGALSSLRTVELFQSWFRRGRPAADAAAEQGTADPERPVVAAILRALRGLHQANGTLLVLVYLPTRTDYDDRRSDGWRTFLRNEAARDDIPLIDLVDAVRSVPGTDIGSFFIQPGALTYAPAEGHYTVRGNEFIARRLHERLFALETVVSRIRARISQAAPDEGK